jgi:hypothetical protein
VRIVAYLVLAASLVIGFIGALTAYVPPLDEPSVTGLHLNAPAGARSKGQEAPEPIASARTELTPEVVAELKESGVERVRVREFGFGRWTGWWLYLIGAAGLLASGLVLRRKRQVETPTGAFASGNVPADPAAILSEMRRRIEGLLGVMPAEPVEGYAEMAQAPQSSGAAGGGRPPLAARVIGEVGQIQATLMPAFIDARPRLVAAFGMGGYARLMDVYAAAERALNRAWSAAADGDEPEAISSLERGLSLLEESARRLSPANRQFPTFAS